MRYRDLLALPYDKRNNVISLETILAALPDTPPEVAEVYKYFGRNREHQHAYADLDIGSIKWIKETLDAGTITNCFILPAFARHLESTSKRISEFKEKGWKCISDKESLNDHWKCHHTWLLPPVFLQRHLVGPEQGLHLLEGHTRVGVLKGLVERSIITKTSTHEVWLGG